MGVHEQGAQIASVLGREIPYHLLSKLAAAYNKQGLDADLQRLADHGLTDIISNGYSYAFRHALIRDVAYDSQLRVVRQRLHGKIVDLVDADGIAIPSDDDLPITPSREEDEVEVTPAAEVAPDAPVAEVAEVAEVAPAAEADAPDVAIEGTEEDIA